MSVCGSECPDPSRCSCPPLYNDRVPSRGSLVRLAIGTLIGLAALYAAFRGSNLDDLRAVFRAVHPGWTLLALASVFATLTVVAIRWRVLLSSLAYPPAVPAVLSAIIAGQACNIVLPIRLGEILRTMIVARRAGAPFAEVAATVVVERLTDLGMLGVSAIGLALLVAMPDWMVGPARGLAATGAIAIGATIILGLSAPRLLGFVERLAVRLPWGWPARFTRHATAGLRGVDTLRRPRTALTVWLLSGAVLMLAASTNALLFAAFGMDLPFAAALFTLVVVQVGTAPVSTPGSIGVFQYLVVLALSAYAIDRPVALAYSLMLYGVALLPKVLIGGFVIVAAFREGALSRGMLAQWGKKP
jgi:uncharacterized membrane protein YbhN (UPF0104 family)